MFWGQNLVFLRENVIILVEKWYLWEETVVPGRKWLTFGRKRVFVVESTIFLGRNLLFLRENVIFWGRKLVFLGENVIF